MRLALILCAAGLWAADAPKPERVVIDTPGNVSLAAPNPNQAVLTDSAKLEIRTLQLRSARVDAAKLQIAAEEKAVNEALSKIVAEWAAKGCTLRDDLTCEKVEGKK